MPKKITESLLVKEEALYNGDVKISFEENKRTGTHSYVKCLRWPDGQYTDWQPTHGITTPLAMIPKPFLKPWASKLAVNRTLEWAFEHPEMADEVLAYLDDVHNEFDKTQPYAFRKRYAKWVSPLKMAYVDAANDGKMAGTFLHKAIEDFYNSDRQVEPITPPESMEGLLWNGFKKFDNMYKPRTHSTEFFVYSKLWGYSGQGDWDGAMADRDWVILDWKTTNRSTFNRNEGIEIDYFYQLGGLAQAKFEEYGRWPDDIGIVNIDKKGGDPVVLFARDFGMSPMDAAKMYVAIHNAFHGNMSWDYRFSKRP